MVDSTTRPTWMTRPAHFASLRPRPCLCQPAKAAACVLDLLGRARPQSHLAVESIIWALFAFAAGFVRFAFLRRFFFFAAFLFFFFGFFVDRRRQVPQRAF